MCRLQIINCTNANCCTNPSGLGVIFCHQSTERREERAVMEYHLVEESENQPRTVCRKYAFFQAETSSVHACSTCDPEGFKLLTNKLDEANCDLAEFLSHPESLEDESSDKMDFEYDGHCDSASEERTSSENGETVEETSSQSEVDVEVRMEAQVKVAHSQVVEKSINDQLLECLEDIEVELKSRDMEMAAIELDFDKMDIDT